MPSPPPPLHSRHYHDRLSSRSTWHRPGRRVPSPTPLPPVRVWCARFPLFPGARPAYPLVRHMPYLASVIYVHGAPTDRSTKSDVLYPFPFVILHHAPRGWAFSEIFVICPFWRQYCYYRGPSHWFLFLLVIVFFLQFLGRHFSTNYGRIIVIPH